MSRDSSPLARNLLWFDGSAGLLVGAVVLLLDDLLSRWYGLPKGVIVFLGIMNVAYGSYALSLAARKVRPLKLVRALALANIFWGFVCVVLVVTFFSRASSLGLALLLGEGLFVGALGFTEWRLRHLLTRT